MRVGMAAGRRGSGKLPPRGAVQVVGQGVAHEAVVGVGPVEHPLSLRREAQERDVFVRLKQNKTRNGGIAAIRENSASQGRKKFWHAPSGTFVVLARPVSPLPIS